VTALATLGRMPFVRLLFMGALVLLLQVPSCMIAGVVQARQASRNEAAADIARTWGGPQDVIGPFLVVPFHVKRTDNKGHVSYDSGALVVLPEVLDARAEPAVEPRRRGLFEIPVFRSRVRLAGSFRAPVRDAAVAPQTELRWREAQLVLRVADVHAIERVAPLRWGARDLPFEAGGGELCAAGVHAALGEVDPEKPAAFAIDLDLRGSSRLRFAPAGRETRVALRSDWPDPSFQGAWLPDERSVGAQGFSARWHVTQVARGLPASWKKGFVADESLMATLFGVELLYPVDPYRMSERSLKYDLLFTGLTFLALWLFELLARRPVHAVQYLLLGAGLCLFYLLELSLAEQLGFALAYGLAAAAVTVQLTLYARASVGARGAATLLGVVGSLYALLYLLLREEDYALLAGSVSLFVILSAVMFLTRRVQWQPSAEAAALQ
jgi:inner membrane protein